MIQLLYAVVGIVIGALITHLLDRILLKKNWKKEESDIIDNILSSLDLEVESNLSIARENQKNANRGRSLAQRTNFNTFSFKAYDHFIKSINSKLKNQLKEQLIKCINDGYSQCRKFNNDFNLYKNGKKPTARLNGAYFNRIIINFQEYQKLRKCNKKS